MLHSSLICYLCISLIGCTTPQQPTIKPPTTVARAMETRSFSKDMKTVLKASINALQDMDYTIDVLNSDIGLITASRTTEQRQTKLSRDNSNNNTNPPSGLGNLIPIVFIAGAGSFFGWEINRNTLNSFFAGTFSGIFGMIAAIGGPPVALLYRNTKSQEFRPSLNSVFSIGILITLSLLILSGNLYVDHLLLFMLFLPVVLVGIRVSSSLFSKVSDSFIAQSVTYFSIISGLYVILRNIN